MEKYFINYEEVSREKFDDEIDKVVESFVNDNYDKLLDDEYPPLKIYGATYDTSRILKTLDPVNYNCIKTYYETDHHNFITNQLMRFKEIKVKGILFQITEEE